MDIDEAYHYLGNWGRYQTFSYILLTITCTWLPAWQIMSMVFTADRTPFHCKASPGFHLNESIPLRDSDDDGILDSYAGCSMYAIENGSLVDGNTTTECTNGYEFTPEFGENTIVMEFDLVCDRSLLSQTAQSVFFGGVLVGAIVNGQLSDLIGRKLVFLGALSMEAIFGIALSFVQTYQWFVVCWFCVGMFEQGINLTGFVMVMEMFPVDTRTVAGCMNNVSWGVGVALLAPIAYWLRDWRYMQFVISLPCFLSIILFWLLMESVRWLVQNGKYDKAEKVLKRIAKFNNIQPPDRFLAIEDHRNHEIITSDGRVPANQVSTERVITGEADGEITFATFADDKAISEHKTTFLDLFKTPNLCKNSVVMFYAWLVNSMVYYGLSLYSSSLAGNKYLNFFLIGLVEIPAYIVIAFTMIWWGRRPSMSVFLLGAGIGCIVTALMPKKTADGTDLHAAIVTAAMLGKFCITSSFGIAFVYGTEIFPTVVRNAGFGIASLWGRVGSMVAPFILYLDQDGKSKYIPLSIFGVLSLVAGLVTLLLPETMDRDLPETLEDGENLGKAKPLLHQSREHVHLNGPGTVGTNAGFTDETRRNSGETKI
ncbi:organic cation transporter protein-like [Amphiura filiformis]|uniref:organic cation transporter protein-like n=1 Tax=Amphiura filiformis TaxID=82378 RepID=UPI003B21A230